MTLAANANTTSPWACTPSEQVRGQAGSAQGCRALARSARYLRLLGRRRLGCGSRGCGRIRGRRCRCAWAATPTYERAGLAGVLVEDDEVEEQLALHVLLADGVIGDALFLRPSNDVLVEQALGVLGRAVLAVVVDQEGELLALRRGGRGGRAHHGGEHCARCLGN